MNELPETRYVKHFRDTVRHRKNLKLARVLGCSRFEAYGVTGALWDFVDEHHPAGDLSGLDAEAISDSIGASDVFDPSELVDAWVTVGLLDQDDDGNLAVHGWTDEGRSGEGHERRVALATLGAHKRHHVNRGNLTPDDCDLCRDMPELAANELPSLATAPETVPGLATTVVPELAPKSLPHERRETRNDQESLKDKRERARENANATTTAPARGYTAFVLRPFVRGEIDSGVVSDIAEIARLREAASDA